MATSKTQIPKTINERRAFLEEELTPLVGVKIECPGLENRLVEFTKESIKETAVQASQSKESTHVALYIVKAIQVAKFVKETPPKSNKQKKLRFQKIYILKGRVAVGGFKLTVGVRRNKRILHYCITNGKGKRRLVRTTTPTSPLSRCKGRKRN